MKAEIPAEAGAESKKREQGKASPPLVRMTNVKTAFRNFSLPPENGAVYARLGEDRLLDSSFSYRSDRVWIEAFVRRGRNHRDCQDAAVVHVNEGAKTGEEGSPREALIAAGIFDGFGQAGTLVSEYAADGTLGLIAQGRTFCLVKGVSEIVAGLPVPPSPHDLGGSTALIAAIYPDGGSSIRAVPDSAAYLLESTGTRPPPERLLDYRLDRKGNPVSEQHVKRYFESRNLIRRVVRYGKPLAYEEIESWGGILDDRCLLLVSDGVTKNLKVKISLLSGKVDDCSGNDDLRTIIRGISSPARIVGAIVEAIDWRLRMPLPRNSEYLRYKDTALCPADDDITIIAIRLMSAHGSQID